MCFLLSWFGSSHGSLKNVQTSCSRQDFKKTGNWCTYKKKVKLCSTSQVELFHHPFTHLCAKIGALDSGSNSRTRHGRTLSTKAIQGLVHATGGGEGGEEQFEGTSSVPTKLYTSLPPFPLSLSLPLSSIPYCVLTPSSSSPPLSSCVHLTASCCQGGPTVSSARWPMRCHRLDRCRRRWW